jgi:hypothetical protein
MWKSLLHASNLVIFNFLVNSYRHLPRLYFVGDAGLRQPQTNWAIRLFANNSSSKYSCHCSILINCRRPVMRGIHCCVQLLAHSANYCQWTTVCNQVVSVNNLTCLSRLCAFNNQQKKEVGPKIKSKNQATHQPFLAETRIRNSKMK